MNLYRISQNANNDWDTYDSAVVVAKTEEEARYTHPGNHYRWDEDAWSFQFSDGTSEKEGPETYDWTDPSNVNVELIGTAVAGLSGVICSSFNAG